MTHNKNILTGNQAVANIAYKTNEVCAIYPCTPTSEMSELVEQWSAQNHKNSFGSTPSIFEMQSEAGVAGTMHGALQTGSLATTFTASQGLLLMIPNMYKIAGQLLPNVIHVATRSVATHALSVFGDHSDIMATRQTGYAFLGSASVQEAHDFALIAQAATLKSRIPFVHFFDGFRTSHETNTIQTISDDIINKMIDLNSVEEHQNRALNPNAPVLRGTAQGADIFFQSREAQNSFYNACPDSVQNTMNQFEELTGRAYKIFDYIGHPEAEHIIISMASSTETIETTINQLNENNNKFGLIKVRLFRPFSKKHLLEALPKTVKYIAVLDRTKESGSTGEPLYLDILQSITEAFQTNEINTLPRIVGGRYGLSSKAFTPSMVYAIYNNLKANSPKNNFTVGITDDITNLSLKVSENIQLKNNTYQAVFYNQKSKVNSQSFDSLLQLAGENSNHIQGYTECDYKKSNSRNVSHLRISENQIKAPYIIDQADFVSCQDVNLIMKDNAINTLKSNGTLLVNSSLATQQFWQALSANVQYQIIEKGIQLYTVNLNQIKNEYQINGKSTTALHASFLSFKSDLVYSDELADIKYFINKVDTSVGYNPKDITIENDFAETLLGKLLANKGHDVLVSELPVDGTYQTNTSQFNTKQDSEFVPVWNTDVCTQCGACSMACPQGSLRIKAYEDSLLNNAPNNFKSITSEEFHLLNYTIQNNVDQCNGCNNCVDACPAKALIMNKRTEAEIDERKNWKYFEVIPELDREKIDTKKVSQQQLQEPLFKYSIGAEGCGEAPYLKLMSQLFGYRLLVANATGASSIFGGALPTTPWSTNKEGNGPAWANSLFEDNAEFGLGYRLSLDQQKQQAKHLLEQLLPKLDFDLVYDILKSEQSTEAEINSQRNRIETLKEALKIMNSSKAKQLLNVADSLVKKSVWIVGGDGWAYDIGFGGLDHVIASGKNVNILIIDNEVYDNTGGQLSKSSPFGAQSKFAFNGKTKQKKDLGLMMMTYSDVYVASVAIGADQEQTLKAFNEAESYDGPSIIIAYSHSESHGIDMKNPSQYHKAAVDSGQWLLYRNDPRRVENNLNTLQLDSGMPTIPIEDYLKLEQRFSKLLNKKTKNENDFFCNLQRIIDKRFNNYLSLASSKSINRAKLLQNKKILKSLNFK